MSSLLMVGFSGLVSRMCWAAVLSLSKSAFSYRSSILVQNRQLPQRLVSFSKSSVTGTRKEQSPVNLKL